MKFLSPLLHGNLFLFSLVCLLTFGHFSQRLSVCLLFFCQHFGWKYFSLQQLYNWNNNRASKKQDIQSHTRCLFWKLTSPLIALSWCTGITRVRVGAHSESENLPWKMKSWAELEDIFTPRTNLPHQTTDCGMGLWAGLSLFFTMQREYSETAL